MELHSFSSWPGGGHCIGVDPYYLTHKSDKVGYRPEMILAGRKINDGMGNYVVSQLIKKMTREKLKSMDQEFYSWGLTFKENCPDIRNSKVIDIINELREFEVDVDVVDPWCDVEEAANEHGLVLKKKVEKGTYDAVIIAVAHNEFKKMGSKEIRELGKPKHILYDLKHVLPKDDVDIRL